MQIYTILNFDPPKKPKTSKKISEKENEERLKVRSKSLTDEKAAEQQYPSCNMINQNKRSV